jgi:hypothetical protein
MKKLIGLSLSCCVADIAEGRVKMAEVVGIISNTKYANPEMAVITEHGVYTGKKSRALRIIRSLMRSGRIAQPRLVNPEHGHSCSRTWIETKEVDGVLTFKYPMDGHHGW